MSKGFRIPAENSRKTEIKALQHEIKQLSAAGRLTQMMCQRLMESSQGIQYDLGKALSLVAELQYKLLAIKQVANLDNDAIQVVADKLRLDDFNESSEKEDIQKKYTTPEVVAEDSVVIITSTSENPEKSIFRSKVALKEINVPDLTKGLLGREVGARVVCKLGDTTHTVELLGIRQPPPAEIVPQPVVAQPVAPAPTLSSETEDQGDQGQLSLVPANPVEASPAT